MPRTRLVVRAEDATGSAVTVDSCGMYCWMFECEAEKTDCILTATLTCFAEFHFLDFCASILQKKSTWKKSECFHSSRDAQKFMTVTPSPLLACWTVLCLRDDAAFDTSTHPNSVEFKTRHPLSRAEISYKHLCPLVSFACRRTEWTSMEDSSLIFT